MNPHDPTHDDLGSLTRAALGDLLDLAPHLADAPVAAEEERRSRVVLVPVAAGLIAVAGVGAVAVIDRGGSGPSGSGSSSPASTPASTPDMVVSGMQWYLPTTVPDGYALVGISGRDMSMLSPTGPLRAPDTMVVVSTDPPDLVLDQTEQIWIRRGADGLTNDDTITVSASGPVNSDWGEPTDTIGEGAPAMVLGPPARESAGWTVRLPVGEILVVLQATDGVSRDEALAAASGVSLEEGRAVLDAAALPAGFELVAPADTVPFDVWASWTEQLDFAADVPLVGSGPIQVTVSSGVWESLDALSVGEDERRVIDGRQYSVTASDDGYVTVRWQADGNTFTAAGTAALDDVLTIATSLGPVTDDAAEAAADAVTETALGLPEKGRATLADGVVVSVRTLALDSEGPAVALCVEEPVSECVRPNGGAVPAWEVVAISSWFDIDGNRRLIAWNGFEPTLGPDQPNVEAVAASSGVGWFLSAPMPDGAESVVLGIVDADGSLTGIGATADLVRP